MKKIVFLAGMVALVTACQQGADPVYTYTAKAYADITRTELNSNNEVLWSTGDQFDLYSSTKVATFTLSEGAGTNLGTFSYTGDAIATGDGYTAYYPAGLEVANDGTIAWPTTQVYSAAKCANAPMVATGITVDAGNSLSDLHFHNQAGLLEITLNGGERVSAIGFHGKKDGVDTDVTLTDCLSAAAGATYYIALEPGVYSQVYLTATDAQGYMAIRNLKSDKTVTISRSEITQMALPQLEFNIVPITANGRTVYFKDRNEGADSQTAIGTPVAWTNLPAAGGHWRVPTQDEMQVLFHYAKTEGDYQWAWSNPCVTVAGTSYGTLCLPTVEVVDEFGQPTNSYSGYYWSSTENGSDAYMYGVTYYGSEINTSEASHAPKSQEAYVRLVYIPDI